MTIETPIGTITAEKYVLAEIANCILYKAAYYEDRKMDYNSKYLKDTYNTIIDEIYFGS